jgi:hypothetical protein
LLVVAAGVVMTKEVVVAVRVVTEHQQGHLAVEHLLNLNLA